MSSNYEPSGPLASMITKKIADSVVDRVFGDQGNDLVVPTLGVSEGSDDPAFPLSSDRLLRYDHSNTVQHTNFFSQSETNEKLLEWLVP
jgi:hypothetical protein